MKCLKIKEGSEFYTIVGVYKKNHRTSNLILI